jgi:hypothetical protein
MRAPVMAGNGSTTPDLLSTSRCLARPRSGPARDGGTLASINPIHIRAPTNRSLMDLRRKSAVGGPAPYPDDPYFAKGGVRLEASDGSLRLNPRGRTIATLPESDRPARDADEPFRSEGIVRPRGGSDFASARLRKGAAGSIWRKAEDTGGADGRDVRTRPQGQLFRCRPDTTGGRRAAAGWPGPDALITRGRLESAVIASVCFSRQAW